MICVIHPNALNDIIGDVESLFVSTTDSFLVYESLLQQIERREQEVLAQQMAARALVSNVSFDVDREELTIHPHIVLHNLLEFVQNAPLRVGFIDDSTRGPGITKEFFSKLVAGICIKLGFQTLPNGLMRPFNANILPEEEEIYRELGTLLSLCLQHNIVIGMQLDRSFFAGLLLVTEEHSSLEISKKTISSFFPIYSKMQSHNEDDIHAVKLMEQSLHEQETIDVLMEVMPQAIMPCIAVRKGMQIEEDYTAEELDKRLQGTVRAEEIIERLEFGSTVTEEWKAPILAWIRTLDNNPKKLKAFLTVVTGAPGLGPKPIQIEISGIAIQAHTCVQLLSLPSDNTIDEVLKELDKAMTDENYFKDK
jgi:hypothetical protein